MSKEIEEKKNKGLIEIKEKASKLQNNNYEKMKEIKIVKQDITQGIKEKLNNTLSLRNEFNKLRRLSSNFNLNKVVWILHPITNK
jgi:hypothetical protein